MITPDPAKPNDRAPAGVRLELLYAPGCPNVDATRKLIMGCLTELGLDTPLIERVGRYRSPTVLVDGVDVMTPTANDLVDGDACRLDLPSRDRVLAAISTRPAGVGRPLTIDSLRDAARDGTTARAATLPGPVRRLHRGVLHAFLSTGRAPSDEQCRSIADAAGVNLTDAFRDLADLDLVHCGQDGRVRVAYPFSGEPTGHSVRLPDTPAVEAMCAIDALGIPLMTDQDAVITSADPVTRHSIRVERRNRRWQWEPATTVVLLARTTRCGTAAECLCPAVTFHVDRDHARHHLTRHPELHGTILDQQDAIEIARLSFGSLLIA